VQFGLQLFLLGARLQIEPAATLVRGYWIWEGPGVYYGVPWTNFIAWFGLALVLSFVTQVLLPHSPFKREQLRVPAWVLGTTVFTFFLVSAVTGKWPVVILAVIFFYCLRRLLRDARSTSLSQ